MGHDGQLRGSRWRLPSSLGAVVLTAGVLAAGLPATAQASTAQASTAPPSAATNSVVIVTTVKALGHTWTLGLSEAFGQIAVALSTTSKGVAEQHQWSSSFQFEPTALAELKVTSTGHATWRTGSALSPVLAISVALTPAKVTKAACVKGSESTYTEKASGLVSLATGLRGVKVKAKFSGQPVGQVTVDRSCIPAPAKAICIGGNWFVTSIVLQVSGFQTLGTKPHWFEFIGAGTFKTASKWLGRGLFVGADGPAPKLNTAAKTISVGGLSGAAVISYTSVSVAPSQTCFVGGKKFTQTNTTYFGTSVTVTKPFVAHSLLAGTFKQAKAVEGQYVAAKLTAA
jgi:hypothetical protein